MRSPAEKGLTLVELMVVVAIVIVLSAVAIISLKSSSYGSGPLGFSREIVAEIEDMRLRAINTRRWQRLSLGQTVDHHESTTFGMALPGADDWRVVRTLAPNQATSVCGYEEVVRVNPQGTSCPGGTGVLLFAPDGTGRLASGDLNDTGATIYVHSAEGAQEYRVTVYGATGMAVLLEGH